MCCLADDYKSVVKSSKTGVFFIPGIGSLDAICIAADLGVDFIRIGVNINRYSDTLETDLASLFSRREYLK
jgi:hypothetical protein